jgi:predicted AAA+ superfamily ATPase
MAEAEAGVEIDALFWLEKANIVIKVPKTNEGKMPLAGYEDLLSFKIYFSDVGLFSAKSNLAAAAILTQNYGGEVKGALIENYVAEELVVNGIRPYYWESRGTAELDFVIQQQDKIIPIAAKANMNTKAKSLDTFRKKYNIEKSIRISAKNFGFENGIKSVPLYAVWCITPSTPLLETKTKYLYTNKRPKAEGRPVVKPPVLGISCR